VSTSLLESLQVKVHLCALSAERRRGGRIGSVGSNEIGRVGFICWMTDVEDGVKMGETRYLVDHPDSSV
jgi:hypothetical protein